MNRLLLYLLVIFFRIDPAISSYRLVGEKEKIFTSSMPNGKWIPDGHFAILRNANSTFSWISAGAETYRIEGDWEETKNMSPSPKFPISKRDYSSPTPDNGGSWFMSIFSHNEKLVSFYHAEDHLWDGKIVRQNGVPIAYKTIRFASSKDGGVQWNKGEATNC